MSTSVYIGKGDPALGLRYGKHFNDGFPQNIVDAIAKNPVLAGHFEPASRFSLRAHIGTPTGIVRKKPAPKQGPPIANLKPGPISSK